MLNPVLIDLLGDPTARSYFPHADFGTAMLPAQGLQLRQQLINAIDPPVQTLTTMTTATTAFTNTSAVEALEKTFAYAEENQLQEDFVGRPQLDFYKFTDQGDIRITRFKDLSEFPPLKEVAPFRQLAPGVNKGSRHCLAAETVTNAKFYNLENPNVIQGPVFYNPEETLITHPEHKHQILPPGWYFVSYQTLFADELKRLAD